MGRKDTSSPSPPWHRGTVSAGREGAAAERSQHKPTATPHQRESPTPGTAEPPPAAGQAPGGEDAAGTSSSAG